MTEKATTPYPECMENDIVLVCEPTTEYGKPIVYQGTTIANALKDYYSFTINRKKVDVLKWIVAQPTFTELKRLSQAENKIFTLYTDQFNEILKTGEIPNNLQIAQKFVENGYDVFLLFNPKGTKSADFIIRQKNKLFYVEGKTSSGGSSLVHRFEKGAEQADRIAINFIGKPKFKPFLAEIISSFEKNENLKELYLFKKSRLISITRKLVNSKICFDVIFKLWNRQK